MKIALSVISLVLTTFCLAQAQDYAIGADLSFLKQAEDNGFEFKENGEAKPAQDSAKALQDSPTTT